MRFRLYSILFTAYVKRRFTRVHTRNYLSSSAGDIYIAYRVKITIATSDILYTLIIVLSDNYGRQTRPHESSETSWRTNKSTLSGCSF